MKNQFMAIGILMISSLAPTISHALPALPLEDNTEITCETPEEICNDMGIPYFDVRICFNAFFVSVCVTLRCDLHWSDALLPGLGQLLGHEGCVPIGEAVSTTGSNPTPQAFEGSAENMIQAIEKVQKVPIGSLRSLTVTSSPTFPLPDGKNYRVVAKTYPIQQTANGRTVALEVELAK